MKPLTILFSLILSLSLYSQERVLLRIDKNGQQEAIPLKKGERAKDVIERLEQQRSSLTKTGNSAGLIDTIKYYGSDADLTTNFGFTHQDVALQWYVPGAGGLVKEVWWRNHLLRGSLNKATIRAWHLDNRMTQLPANAYDGTGRMGYYEQTNDGDGLVTPFRIDATDSSWKPGNGSDTSIHFDPLTSEAKWLPGGLQVSMDSAVWQGINLENWGDSMVVRLGEPFGFTLMNDSKASDGDARLEILSTTAQGAPYHSIKFYEIRTAAANTPGWQIRAYEWGMYVVVEYCTDRPPRFYFDRLGTTLSTNPRKVNATIDGLGGCYGPYEPIAFAYLHFKQGSESAWDSVMMTQTDVSYFSSSIPGFSPGDKVYYKVTATTTFGTRRLSAVYSYSIFGGSKIKNLFIYNNASFSITNSKLIYLGSSSRTDFDFWSAPNDGTVELSALMALYDNILIADGSFPSRNVYTALKERLAAATEMAPISVFFTSQDYGCYIEGACADTTFAAGTMEYDYFGISKIGPQDLLPTNREFRVIPQPDPVTDYLIKWGADSGSTLWYDPTFELGFSGYQDALTPRAEAKAIFKDGGTNVIGAKYITSKTRTAYLGFDAGALQFRSDTALAAGSDPKYKWIVDVGSVSLSFFKEHGVKVSVQPIDKTAPDEFILGQNYPNPFNPSTAIEYSIASKSAVTISVYNMLGQKVATLVNETKDPGSYRAEWNASRMASGLYFYEMRASNYTSVKKMLLLK